MSGNDPLCDISGRWCIHLETFEYMWWEVEELVDEAAELRQADYSGHAEPLAKVGVVEE